MSNIVHDKYHHQTHHSFINPDVTDAGLDPIASKELPFSGEFIMDNADNDTWLLSSDRVAFEWVSGYNNADSLKFDVGISGTNGKTITYPSGNFGNVVISGGLADVPVLSVVGKTIFTDDIIHNGNLKVSSIDATNISADTVLISGNDGFVLNVTNGSSRFNDVTGNDFTITGNTGVTGDVVVGGNAEVGGDLNVHENLYFTSGIANCGFLNVAGSAFFKDLKVSGKIEAPEYYFERTTGINIPSDGGWKLSGTMSNTEKGLIPDKDEGAVTYDPGINNMTLSAMGLSSDSWASFGGNVLIHGDNFYVDADETYFTEPIFVDEIVGTKATFDELSGINLSGAYLSGTKATFDELSGINLSANNLIVGNIMFSGENSQTTLHNITADKMSFYEEGYGDQNNLVISLTKNTNWGGGLVWTQSLRATKVIEISTNDISRSSNPVTDSTNYRYRVPNIGFCDDEYLDLVLKRAEGQSQSYTGSNAKNLVWRITDGEGHHMPNEALNTWQFRQWYHQARGRIWEGGQFNGYKHVVECLIPQKAYNSIVNSGYVLEFYVRFVFDGNVTLTNQLTFQLLDNDGHGTGRYLSLNRMYGANGSALTMSELRGGVSGTLRVLTRVYLDLYQGPKVEIIGRSQLAPAAGWFI